MTEEEPRDLPRAIRAVERATGGVALLSFRFPIRTLLGISLLCLWGLFAARNLRLNADLADLLPRSFQSLHDLEKLIDRFGGIGYVVVVAQHAEPDQLRRFADEVAPRLAKVDGVRYVEYRRPVSFFRNKGLYYLETDELELIAKRLREREAWEKRQRNPFYLDLEDEQPPDVAFEELEKKYLRSTQRSWLAGQLGEPYYLDNQMRMIALLAKPQSAASDLAFSTEIVNRVQAFVDTLDLSPYGSETTVALTGRYKKRVDQQQRIERDLAIASTVALLLMILYVAFHFRRALAAALIMLPLVAGLIWTFGMAAIAFGTLNILTGFIGAVLLGVGIDHGIHLLDRYWQERARRRNAEEAIRKAFAATGRAVIIAALTTTVGFGGLGLSEFRAFREFGMIAAAGIPMVVISFLTTLPALLGLAARLGWHPPLRGTVPASPMARFIAHGPRALLAVSAALLLIASLLLPSARFDYDFARLEGSDLLSFQLDHEVNRLVGYSQTPVMILTESEEDERLVTRALRDQQARLGERSTVDFVATIADLIPPDQEKKRALLASIGEVVDRVEPSWLEPELRPLLEEARTMTAAVPFARSDLPVEARRQLQGSNAGPNQGFVAVFPSVSLSDGERIMELADEVRGVTLADGRTVSAAGEAMILNDILRMVIREAPPVLVFTFVLVFVTLWLLLGKIRTAAVCLIPAGATLIVTLGLLPLVDLRLNYLNIVILPVLFGISVDGGAHIVTRLKGGQSLFKVLCTTGRSIIAAILTTGFGFGALLLADHPGLRSLARLAIVGLTVNLLACLVVLPALLGAWQRWRDARPVARRNVEYGRQRRS